MKKSIFAGVLSSILSVVLFTNCENFLTGGDFKKELETDINYAKAPIYKILVKAESGSGSVKIPATGEALQKVSDTFTVKFEPAQDCEFYYWVANIDGLKPGELVSDYIEFEDAKKTETKVTLKKADSSVQITLCPVSPVPLAYEFFPLPGVSKIHTRDSSIEITFNQPLDKSCFYVDENTTEVCPASDFITIGDGTLSASTYFKSPVIREEKEGNVTVGKVVFSIDTSSGYIPVSGSGSAVAINVKIPKERIWRSYLNNIKVGLEEDIDATYNVGSETSSKVQVTYSLKENDEGTIGTLRVNDFGVENKTYSYSVGDTVSLRYKMPSEYTFNGWTFTREEGEQWKFDTEGNMISSSAAPSSEGFKIKMEASSVNENNLVVAEYKIENYMSGVINIEPDVTEPVYITFCTNDGIDTFKADKTKLFVSSDKDVTNPYGVGKSVSISCTLKEGYTFEEWKLTSKNDDAFTTETDPANPGVLTLTINKYTDTGITVTPVVCAPVKIKFVKPEKGVQTFKAGSTTIEYKDEDELKEQKGLPYAIGKTVSLSCKLEDGYTFDRWKFTKETVTSDEEGNTQPVDEELTEDDVLIKQPESTESGVSGELPVFTRETDPANPGLLNLTINKYTALVITVTPVVLPPVYVKFEKKPDGIQKIKSGSTEVVYGTEVPFAKGSVISLSCDLADGYGFKGWKFTTKKNGSDIDVLNNDDFKGVFSVETNTNNSSRISVTVNEYVSDPITVTPEVYEPVKVKFQNYSAGIKNFKAGNISVSGTELNQQYKVDENKVISVSCKVDEGYAFKGWEISRTYKDENGNDKTDVLDDSSDINLSVDFGNGTDQNGYNPSTRYAMLNITVNGNIDGVINIKPQCSEILCVTKFNLDDADKVYERDSEIKLTFNKPIEDECIEKISVKIGSLFNVLDYYNEPEFNSINNTLSFVPNLENGYIPVNKDAKRTVTVRIPASDVYSISDTGEKLTMESDVVYTFTINEETTDKVKFKFAVEDDDAGLLKINDVRHDGIVYEYSMGKTIQLKYKSYDGYKFNGFLFSKITGQDEDGIDIIENVTVDSLTDSEEGYFSIEYDDSDSQICSITINKKCPETIIVTASVSEIPSVNVRIETESGTGTTSPTTGLYSFREGAGTSIEFSPIGDYEFIRWQITDATTGNAVDSKQISIGNSKDRKTELKINSISNLSGGVILKPVVAMRPKIISHSPTYVESGSRMDATVQVMFDKEMDSDSIYYTEEELNSIAYERLLKTENTTNGKVYGYVRANKTFFKNISVVNNYDGSSLLEHFEPPVFENGRTLSIPVKNDNLLPAYTQVLVTIDKDFFCKENGAKVSMYSSEKWLYQINEDTDNVPPVVSTDDFSVLIEKDGTPLTTVPVISDLGTLKFLKNSKVYMDLSVNDLGGLSSSFNLVCTKKFDGNYEAVSEYVQKTIGCSYSGSISSRAVFKGDVDLSSLDDGVYSLSFIFNDKSGNPVSYPDEDTYFFTIDTTAPAMSAPAITDGDADGKINVNWNYSSCKDFKDTKIEYRVADSEDDFINAGTILKGESLKELNLEGGTDYEFKITYSDLNDNKRVYSDSFISRPNTPDNLIVDAQNNLEDTPVTYGDTAVKLTMTKPDSGNFDGYRIRYYPQGTSNENSWNKIDVENWDDETETEIDELENGTIYEFEVCSYDSESGKYSLPYKVSNVCPQFITLPAEVTDIEAVLSSTTYGYFNYTQPVSDYTAINVIYSTNSDFTNSQSVSIPKVQANGSKQLTGLTAGTRYYIKAEAYFVNPENKVSTACAENLGGSSCTKPNPVASFSNNASALTNDSITVNWTKPSTGGVDGYYVLYKKSSESSYSSVRINDVNTLSYTIENLSGGNTYNVLIYAVSNGKNSVSSSTLSIQTKPNSVTNFAANKDSTDTSKINLSWTKPTDIYTGVKVYYAASEDALATATPTVYANNTTVTHTISGLTTGSTYYFKIRSYINDSLYTDSDVISCSTSINPVSNLSVAQVANNSSQLSVSWTNPAEFDGVRVYRSTSSSFSTSTSTLVTTITTGTPNSTSSCTVTGLTPNTYYYIHVVSYKNINGTEATARASSGLRTHAAVVTNLNISVTSPTTATVSWTNPANTSYWNYSKVRVFQGSTSVGNYLISDKTVTSYSITDLTPGVSYRFYVCTYNNNGNYNGGYASVTKTTPPAAVTGLTVTSTSTNSSTSASVNSASVTLSWTAPAGNVTKYKIYYVLSGSSYPSTAQYETTNTSYTISNITAAKYYYFKVESVLDGVTNIGTYSYATTGTYTCPTVPRGFSLSTYTTTSQTYIWTAPVSGCSGYYLYYKKTTESSWSSKYITSSSTSYTLTNLTPGTKYDVYLKAYNYSTGYSNDTSQYHYYVTTAAPTGVAVRASNGGTYVSWNAPTGLASEYRVYYRNSSGTENYISTTNRYYTFETLSKESYYTFYVKAKSSYSEWSAASDSVSFWTPPEGISSLSIYSDDGMGTYILRYYCPNTTYGAQIDLFVNDVYICMPTFTQGTWVNYTLTKQAIKNEMSSFNPRNSSYTIRLATYHTKNGASGDTASWAQRYKNETYGYAPTVTTSTTGKLTINGTQYSYSNLNNVITTRTYINNTSTSYASLKDGAFPSNRYVYLSAYSMGAYEVTQQLYQAVMGTNPSTSVYTYYPVNNVSYYHAIAFCNKLSVLQGLTPCYNVSGISNSYWGSITHGNVPADDNNTWNAATLNRSANGYRLPTECEHEFAARGGSTSYSSWAYNYPGSNTLADVAWVKSNSSNSLHTVGTKPSNRLSLYDMSGNIKEWLSDWNYDPSSGTYYDPYCGWSTSNYTGDPSTLAKKEKKVLLKGGYYGSNDNAWVDSNGDKWGASQHDYSTGFRVCRSAVCN